MDLCEKVRQEIGAYVWEPLPTEIAEHLKECAVCRDLLSRLRDALSELAALLPEPDQVLIDETKRAIKEQIGMRNRARKRRRMYYLSIPVAAAALLFLYVLVRPVPQPRSSLVEDLNGPMTWMSADAFRVIEGSGQGLFAGKQRKSTAVTRLSWLSSDGLRVICE